MENMLINFDVYCILKTVSLKLREWVDKSNSGAACRLSLTRFRDVTRAYVSVCEAVKGLSETRGGIIFILFSANSLFTTMSFFNLIDYSYYTSGAKYHALAVFVQVFWCVVHLSTAVIFIEPWHQISAEVKAMRILLIKLKLNMTPVGMSIPLELDLMFKQLLLNQPTMSPLGLVTIQRSLLTKTISFITTYFVIMVQCMQKRWEKSTQLAKK
ncbi:uncharacterized protein LOC124533154 [Vanessa cardui]|uniref:uncharacterized protein LOC124533154 n=1 Tax=Vanessa cardui TaxID=171605 RepID=UPI001F13099E|nr:uncharacterized protein LOC124533154 [Vanessa cardui]